MELETDLVKLTNWENEPGLKELKENFLASKSSHDSQCEKIDSWLDILHTSGSEKKYLPKSKLRSHVQPKLVRRQNEWRYSALSEPFLSSDKIFQVNPRTFEDLTAAKQNELLLNYQFDTKLNKVKFIDDLVHCTVDMGTSIVRLSWKRDTEIVKENVPVYSYQPIDMNNQELANQIQQAIQLKQTNPREFYLIDPSIQESVKIFEQTQQLVIAIPIGVAPQDKEIIKENTPCIEVIDPRNVYIDPSCNGDINKALFIISTFETNKADLLSSGINYQNLDQIAWKGYPSDINHISSTPSDFTFNDDARNKQIAYEYWGYYDIHNNGTLVPIVATWINDTLIRLEENPFPDKKLPFVIIPYSPIFQSVYGEPDAEVLQDNQRILGALTRGIIDSFGRSANSQIGFAKGMLDPINKAKFERGEDYEFNPTINPLAGGYIEHKYQEIAQSAFLMLQLQNQEAESLTGIKAFSGGLSSDAYGQIATGIKGMIDAASKREMSILRRIAKGVAEIGNKIIAMNAVFLSEEEVVRVTNFEFIAIRREDIKGNFDLKVDINTAEVDNTKAQDLAFMLQTIGPNLDPTIMLNILAEIAELKRMPTLANSIRNYKPQPDPMEQQLKQLEIAKLQSEIEYNKARTAKEYAQSQNINIDSELTGSGIKHQQEVAKQKAQAQANQDLEITKAIVKNRKPDEIQGNISAGIGYNEFTKENNQ